jgi:hypothetical protein
MADDTNPTEQPTDDTPTGDIVEPAQKDSAKEPGQGDEGTLGTSGKAALEQERRARREADRARREAERARKDLERQLREFQDREKTDAEKAVARAEGAEQRVAGLLQRAVRAEVRALAVEKFADVDDAIAFLNLASYADEDGEIDAEQIKADLADLLERKPHLAKKAPEPEKRKPAPDRTQASSANSPRSSSPEDEFAGFIKSRLR